LTLGALILAPAVIDTRHPSPSKFLDPPLHCATCFRHCLVVATTYKARKTLSTTTPVVTHEVDVVTSIAIADETNNQSINQSVNRRSSSTTSTGSSTLNDDIAVHGARLSLAVELQLGPIETFSGELLLLLCFILLLFSFSR